MKKIFSIIITLAMVLSMVNAPMASAATAVDIGEDWAVWVEDDCSTKGNVGGMKDCGGTLNSTYGFIYQGCGTTGDHGLKIITPIAGDFAITFNAFINDIDKSPSITKTAYIRAIAGNTVNILDWNDVYKISDETSLRAAEYATAKRKYGVTEVTDGTPTYMECKVVWKNGVMSTYYKWNTSDSWVQRGDNNKSYTVSDEARTVSIPTGTYAGIDNLKIYMPKENIPKTPMMETEEWGIQSENDFSSNITGIVPYYSYYIGHDSTYGFVRNSLLSTTYWGDARNANHWLGMAEGIKGDFAIDFDYFMDDIAGENFLVSDTSDDCTFRLKAYAGELTKSGNYNKLSTELCSNLPVWKWTVDGLADDNGTRYTYSAAKASSKYASEPTDGTPSWLDVRVVLIGDTLTAYAKWNTASMWKQVYTSPLASTEEARGLILINGANVGIDNFKVLRPKENLLKIPTTVTGSEFLGDDADNMIVNPHFGTPAFTEPNGTVDIEFTNNTGVDFAKGTTYVYLSNEYKAWYAKPETPKSGENNIYLGTKSGWTTTIEVPGDISPELMDLEIVHEADDGTITKYFAPQAVQVTEKLNQDFYSVAISDTHIDKWGGNGSQTKTGRILKLINETLSLAGARYLSHSGDIHDAAVPDRAGLVKETIGNAFVDSSIPFIVVAGNHEYDTYTYPVGESVASGRTAVTYEEYVEQGLDANKVQIKNTFTEKTFDEFYGTKTAAIKMGEDMLIAKNDFGAWKWLTDEATGDPRYNPVFIKLRDGLATEWEKDEYDGDYRVVYQHCHNTGKRTADGNYAVDVYGTAAFMSSTCHEGSENMAPYDVQYTGHYHETYAENDKVLTLGGDGKNNPGAGNGVISNFTYNANAEGKKWTNSINDLLLNNEHVFDKENVDNIQDKFIEDQTLMVNSVECNYYNANDGTADFNIATVTNKIDFNFYDGRVKFIMPVGDYTVSGGTKLAQYNSYDNKYTIVLAKVDIPAATEEADGVVNVAISATDLTTDTLALRGAETGFVGADVTTLDLVSSLDKAYTASDVTVQNDGFDVEFTITNPDVKTSRINFTNALVPNSTYTVKAGGKEFAFTVLPSEGIEFIKNKIIGKGNSGYSTNTTSSSTGANSPITVTIDGETKRPQDLLYKDYVLDYTLAIPAYGQTAMTAEEHVSRLDWYVYTKDSEGTLKGIRPNNWMVNLAGSRPNGLGAISANKGWISMSPTVLTNNFKLSSENTYDFRAVKIGQTWTLYAKNFLDDRYDILFTMSGDDCNIFDTEGYTAMYVSVPNSQSYWYNYILYPIENNVTVEEKVGQEFDVTFDVQPKDLSSVTIDGVGDVTFTKTGVKTYKATMPSTWTKKSADAVLSGITDIYSTTASDVTLSAAEYEVDMRNVVITQNNEETDSVKAGDYTVKVTCDKNYALPEGTKLVCAAYAGGSLVSVKTVAPEAIEAMNYNGSEYTFDMTSEYDVSQIKLFAFDMSSLTPLAKSIQ